MVAVVHPFSVPTGIHLGPTRASLTVHVGFAKAVTAILIPDLADAVRSAVTTN